MGRERYKKYYQGGYYHIYNRGVEKRNIFLNKNDYERFLLSAELSVGKESVGNIRDYLRFYHKSDLGFSLSPTYGNESDGIIDIICYYLLPNHYHLIVKELHEGGVSKFLQRLITGYTKYFNNKYERTGVLFQGKTKSRLINSDEYLLWLSVYVNCNCQVHKIAKARDYNWSSFRDYIGLEESKIKIVKDNILSNFSNQKYYLEYCQKVIPGFQERKDIQKYVLE